MRALVIIALGLAGAAAGQPTAAARDQALTDEGIELLRQGRAADAIARFKEAERAVPRHVHDCNIAQAYLRLDRLPQAFLFLERCEARMGRSPEPWVKSSLEALRRRLEAGPFGRVTVRATPASAVLVVATLAADESWPLDGERTLWLPAGRAELEVRAEAMAAQRREVEVAPHGAADVQFALAPPVVVAVSEPPPPAEPRPTRRARWPLVPAGLGLGAAIAGAVFFGLSASAAGELSSLDGAGTSRAFTAATQSQQYDTLGLGLLLGGAVLAVAGLVLFFVLPEVSDP
ncbi:MAG: hypothetical protein JNK82_00505 [Myxococcaceae bacterium]|nr:hypothetical protein [Myxococcaceae bacterium]